MRRLVSIFTAVLLVSSWATAGEPKESDFPVTFLVRTASTVPGYGGSMSLEEGKRVYYVKTVDCLMHCYVFQPGEHMRGRYGRGLRRGYIEILITEQTHDGKPHVGRYQIESTQLLPAQ